MVVCHVVFQFTLIIGTMDKVEELKKIILLMTTLAMDMDASNGRRYDLLDTANQLVVGLLKYCV